MDGETWRETWRPAEGGRLAREVFARLLSGRPLTGLALDEHRGRLDLRGFPAPGQTVRAEMADAGEIPAAFVDLPEIAGRTLEGLDFTGADLADAVFFDSVLADCVFDRARFSDPRVWSTEIRDCSFRDAPLADLVLAADHGVPTVCTRVDFSGADLRRMVSRETTFTDVDFSGARMSDIDFHASAFIRCTFAGPLRRIIFWDRPPGAPGDSVNPMEDIDFTGAELRWVEFRGLRLDRVALPPDGAHVVVGDYRRVLERAIERLSVVSPHAAAFGHQLHWAHPQRTTGIWFREDLGDTEEEREAIVTVLREAEKECGGEQEPSV
ncbi:pentapeptide repeat-containing protein [Streptomyces sp. NPDC051018]|uniref:pentapeptide repeat-containing protein n=1 Tax=Streptomyces sp. NPDC051018 TaxID=3365639 RepID=UPI0037B1649A